MGLLNTKLIKVNAQTSKALDFLLLHGSKTLES